MKLEEHVTMTIEHYDLIKEDLAAKDRRFSDLQYEHNALLDAVKEALHKRMAEDYRVLGHLTFDFDETWGDVMKMIGYEFPEEEKKELLAQYEADEEARNEHTV